MALKSSFQISYKMMKNLYQLLFIILANNHCCIAQPKPIELIWQMDTSSFAPGRSLPAAYQGGIKQKPGIIHDGTKTTLFSYPLAFGNEKIYLNCCLMVKPDSVGLAVDKNFDSIFQNSEIFQYTIDQYKNENLAIHFSVKYQDNMEAFFLLGSIKKTSVTVNTPDSLLSLNPLYLQSKNYLRSSFMQGDEMYYLVLMNAFPAIGMHRNFQYLVTKKEIDDSAFKKTANWLQDTDTVVINEKQAIVATRKNEGGIGFSLIKTKIRFGTFTGAKMPKITVTSIENVIFQLPITQTGKYNLIEFWGTWCGPCTALYPRLDSLLKANAHILTYTGITGHDDKEKVLRYTSKKPTIKNQVFEADKNESIASLFNIHAFPTFILVDEKGVIVAKKSGSAGLDLVEKLISESAAGRMNSSDSN